MSKIQSCTKHNDGYIRWSEGEVCPLCKLEADLATAKEKNKRLEGIIIRFKAGCKITGKGPVDKDCEMVCLLQQENQVFRFVIGVALALENIEAIKGTLRNCP